MHGDLILSQGGSGRNITSLRTVMRRKPETWQDQSAAV
jgi:hypothetical protein